MYDDMGNVVVVIKLNLEKLLFYKQVVFFYYIYFFLNQIYFINVFGIKIFNNNFWFYKMYLIFVSFFFLDI